MDPLIFKLGTVKWNDMEFKAPDPHHLKIKINLLSGYIHIFPKDYSPADAFNSLAFCYDSNKTLEMKKTLEKYGCLVDFNNITQAFDEEKKVHDDRTDDEKQEVKTQRFTGIRAATSLYLSKLKKYKIKSNDPGLLIHNKKCRDGPFIQSSLAYHDVLYGPPNPTTDDILYLNNGTMLADLSNPGPPYKLGTDWAKKIKSAHVPSGCLRLFKDTNYGGIFLFLWGPNGDYPNLSQFGFNDLANSLQQSP